MSSGLSDNPRLLDGIVGFSVNINRAAPLDVEASRSRLPGLLVFARTLYAEVMEKAFETKITGFPFPARFRAAALSVRLRGGSARPASQRLVLAVIDLCDFELQWEGSYGEDRDDDHAEAYVRQTEAVSGNSSAEARDTLTERVELVLVDYEATRSMLDGVVSTSGALRGLGLTLVLALLGFAVERASVVVALCGVAAVGVFWFLDSYHGWLYSVALRRAQSIEHLLALRYRQLERLDSDPDVATDLEIALASHRFGQYSDLRAFTLRDLGRARPRAIYIGLYGTLLGFSIAAFVYAVLA